jgi:hypothetical protein
LKNWIIINTHQGTIRTRYLNPNKQYSHWCGDDSMVSICDIRSPTEPIYTHSMASLYTAEWSEVTDAEAQDRAENGTNDTENLTQPHPGVVTSAEFGKDEIGYHHR